MARPSKLGLIGKLSWPDDEADSFWSRVPQLTPQRRWLLDTNDFDHCVVDSDHVVVLVLLDSHDHLCDHLHPARSHRHRDFYPPLSRHVDRGVLGML